MLRAATLEHSPLIHRWLRAGAADGSFETEIADDSAAATLFLATVDGALATGYLKVPGPEGRLDREVHVAGYVYSPREGASPVGFGLFREVGPEDFELWLTGVAVEARGRGHGRAMMRELLATPPGRLTSLVRCTRTGAHVRDRAQAVPRVRLRALPNNRIGSVAGQRQRVAGAPPTHRGIAACGLGAITGPPGRQDDRSTQSASRL